MDYPGLKGKVKNNWPKRVVPTVIASTIGIGYSVVASQLGGKSSEDRIDTRDEFVQGTAAQSVGLTQDEVLRYRQDLPNTIKVGPRTTFRVLLLKPLKVQL
jgi:type IV secretory pathway VirB10-like protein